MSTLYPGLDVLKDSVVVATAPSDRSEPLSCGKWGGEPRWFKGARAQPHRSGVGHLRFVRALISVSSGQDTFYRKVLVKLRPVQPKGRNLNPIQ